MSGTGSDSMQSGGTALPNTVVNAALTKSINHGELSKQIREALFDPGTYIDPYAMYTHVDSAHQAGDIVDGVAPLEEAIHQSETEFRVKVNGFVG